MPSPKISIIVPICNTELYLRECLDSIISQTLLDIEIICVNDGSTDSSPEILKEYRKKDRRIKIINKPNSGYGHSMNIGITRARGEYIGIVESDDSIVPHMFETLLKNAESNNVDVVKSSFYYYTQNGDRKYIPANIFHESECYRKINPQDEQFIFLVIPSIWSAIYRKEFLVKNNIFFLETSGASYQDTSFNFKVWSAAESAYLISESLVNYRQDNMSSSIKSKEKVFCICDEFTEIERFLESNIKIKEKLETVKDYLKYRAYMWNYGRLTWKRRHSFLPVMSREFKKTLQHGRINESTFLSIEDWRNYCLVAKSPLLFLLKDILKTATRKLFLCF